MRKKILSIPLPVAAAVAGLAVVILGYIVYATMLNRPSAAVDTRATVAEIQHQTPANAPTMRPGINPTAGARGGGPSKMGGGPGR